MLYHWSYIFKLLGIMVVFKGSVVMSGVCPRIKVDQECPWDLITFWLYTSYKKEPIQLKMDSLANVPWVEGPIKVLVHGYGGNKDESPNDKLRPAYLATGDYNVVSVDWGPLASQGCYFTNVLNLRPVGRCLAHFVNNIGRQDVHLLGLSLGAHVVAWASLDIPDLPRLTKFDPAGPMIDDKHSTDGYAKFVDVYHTNSGVLGQLEPSGHLDVYFNNYVYQPGCDCDGLCSHLRSVVYYAEGVRTGRPIKAFPCPILGQKSFPKSRDCPRPTPSQIVDVGEQANPSSKGKYMAFAKGIEPYLLDEDVYLSPEKFGQFSKYLQRTTSCPTSPYVDMLKEAAKTAFTWLGKISEKYTNSLFDKLIG